MVQKSANRFVLGQGAPEHINYIFTQNACINYAKRHLVNVFSEILWVTRERNVFFFLKGYFFGLSKEV